MPWVTTVYTPMFGRANNQWQLLLPGLFEDCRPMRYQPLSLRRKETDGLPAHPRARTATAHSKAAFFAQRRRPLRPAFTLALPSLLAGTVGTENLKSMLTL